MVHFCAAAPVHIPAAVDIAPRAGPSHGLRGQATTEPVVHFCAAAPVHIPTAVDKRASEKRVLKLIGAFFKAGVMEDGLVYPVDEGTPQGGPLSPLLSVSCSMNSTGN